MPILNLNGTTRKHAAPIKGTIDQAGIAAHQHGVTVKVGTSYQSPFTASARSVFPTGRTIATTPYLPPLKSEAPGDVVHLSSFVRVQPHEKGSHFATTQPVHHLVNRAGGPSIKHDTAKSPNASMRPQPRPTRHPFVTSENQSHLSFLRSGGTLRPHSNLDSSTSRWHVVKKGVVA
jgi:hypothetical protein